MSIALMVHANQIKLIILCADISDSVVKYTLPEDNYQIFSSKYKLYMTTDWRIMKIKKQIGHGIARMGERLNGIQEVMGSNPTIFT